MVAFCLFLLFMLLFVFVFPVDLFLFLSLLCPVLDPFNDCGGRGCNKFVPVLGGDSTKTAPVGGIFDQPPGGMS